jgi:hypothetical protein
MKLPGLVAIKKNLRLDTFLHGHHSPWQKKNRTYRLSLLHTVLYKIDFTHLPTALSSCSRLQSHVAVAVPAAACHRRHGTGVFP